MNKITRAEILAECKEWMDVPFIHQGRSKVGCDCGGLVQCVGVGAGCDAGDLPEVPTYGRDPDDTMEKLLNKYLNKKPITQRKPASLLFFGFGKKAQHIGILSENCQTFYHGFEKEGKVVETRLDQRWLKRLRGVYDYKEVID